MAFTLVSDSTMVIGDTSNSKPAAVFKGGDTDDAVSLHTTAAAATTANHTTGTIIAWICPGNNTSTSAIVSFNDANVVEFIDFKMVAAKLSITCTDATVAQFVSTTTNNVLVPHKWQHVAVVQAADGLGPKIYYNGVAQAMTHSTSTDLNEWFNNLDGIDQGFIGASSTGGAGAVTEEFVGAITDVKYYSTAHTAEEILADYQGAVKASPYFWFKFDLDLTNSGTEATACALVSDAYITPAYNEFMSKLRYMITAQGTIVTGDIVGYTDVNGRGSALIVNVA